MKSNEKERREYVISEESRQLLSALDKLIEFKEGLLDALTAIYGDKEGEEFFLEHTEKFEDMERIVMDYLRIRFTSERRVNGEAVII